MMLGVCYYPEQWPKHHWPNDAKRMRQLGLGVVRIGEFAWSRLEPKEGVFDFTWLDEVMEILHSNGLKVVLGTPTATPPRWLIDQYPDMLPVDIHHGQVRRFGSRRHYDIAHRPYRDRAKSICQRLAERYAKHPALLAWQIDNELGCHDTTHSASEVRRVGFQHWCRQRYQSIEKLNEAWGNVFWSMEYQSFEQIDTPFMTVTECNPSHQLAYRRYCSDETLSFVEEQCETIRRYSPNKGITHNFIPLADTQFDYFEVAKALDFASYDSYPLGRSDLFFSEAENLSYLKTGHPDLNAFYLAQTRSLCADRFWVMEQQPGPVNWANNNPRPKPGMIRLWTFEAFAQGAACVSFFRWRQAAFAQEQMHAGLLRVDNSEAEAFGEVEQSVSELKLLNLTQKELPAKVAIVFDVNNQWLSEIEKQASDYCYDKVLFDYYSSLRQLGVECDFISPKTDFSPYALIVVPCQMQVDEAFINHCQSSEATIIFGPRTGSKTQEFQLEPQLAPGLLQQLIPIKVLATETLPTSFGGDCVWQGKTYKSRLWREQISVGNAEILCRNEVDDAVLIESGRYVYLASQMEPSFIKDFLRHYCEQVGVSCMDLPPSLRVVRRGQYGFAFNYSNETQEVPLGADDTVIIGNRQLASCQVMVWQDKNNTRIINEA